MNVILFILKWSLIGCLSLVWWLIAAVLAPWLLTAGLLLWLFWPADDAR
jgi:hypothetical protein